MGIKINEVLANVRRPTCDQLLKLCDVVGEQRSRGFLKVRQISSDCRHEAVGPILQLSQALPIAKSSAPGRINEFSQCRRGTARLLGQPLPMLRQQRDLPRDDA